MAIVGCSTREEVKTLAGIRRETAPPDETERARIVKKFKPYASQLAFAGGVV